jgi:hypothetical protein
MISRNPGRIVAAWIFGLGASSLVYAAPGPVKVAGDVIGLYQTAARRKYGREIYLKVDHSPGTPNAYSSFHGPDGGPQIRILVSMIEAFRGETIAATVCHELGHFFGDASRGTRDGVLALESEADYFEGECLVVYFMKIHGLPERDAEARAMRTASDEAEAFEGRPIDPRLGLKQTFDGAPTDHPPPECRLLTVMNRIERRARPACIEPRDFR